MEAQLAPSANLLALPDGTELVGDYRIKRVLGTGGFGITYLADEPALGRLVTIKEYFPAEFAARRKHGAVPRSHEVKDDYQWGLDRFIEEAQTLARFDHPNIVRVHRYFRANNTAYMVLHFEEGGSFRAWLKNLKRPPRQAELDKMIAPLLSALEVIHDANFLHRDIAPDNIMVRKDGSPVLIDFGSARGAVTSRSHTVSALVKPGYSPYEQYATNAANQGPWTDIYALGATLYHAVTGKRPPDAPSRMVSDEYVPAREVALGSYRASFLDAIDKALRIEISERPQRISEWREALLAPEPRRKPAREATRKIITRKPERLLQRLPKLPLARTLDRLRKPVETAPKARSPTRRKTRRPSRPDADSKTPPPVEIAVPPSAAVPASLVPAPPDAPQRKGQLLDFIDALRRHRPPAPAEKPSKASTPSESRKSVAPEPAAAPEPSAAPPAPAAAAGEPVAPAAALAAGPRSSDSRPSKRRGVWPGRARRWGKGLIRVAAAVAVTGLFVAYQEHVARFGSRSAGAFHEASAPSIAMQLPGHRGAVIAVASADEDRWIVSAGADATVRLWSGSSGALVRTIELAEGPVTAFAVDARRALVGHQSGAIVLWDLEHGHRIATLRHGSEPITSLAFLGDGFVAAGQDGSVALFEDGASDNPAALLDSEKGGPLIAAAHRRGMFVSSGLDRAVRVWSAPGPRLTRTYRSLTDDVTAIDIAADGSRIAGGSSDGTIRLWPNPALRRWRRPTVLTYKAHEGRVTAIALGPSGMVASAGADGSIKLGSLRPQVHMRTLAAGPMRTLSFSRDGRRLLAGGEDGVIRVWSVPAPLAMGAI